VKELVSSAILKIDLFGTPFSVFWHSEDQRRFCNQETCYELVSFEGFQEHDQELLRVGLPFRVERCWVANPQYQHNVIRERLEWQRIGQKCPALVAGYYYPPQASGLRLIDPNDVQVSRSATKNLQATLLVQQIVKACCRTMVSGPASSLLSEPGIPTFMSIFSTGTICFFRAVEKCPMPSEAQALWLLKTLRKNPQITRRRPIESRAGEGIAHAGRLRYTQGFMQVWLEGEVYDLRNRKKARYCIQYLVEHKAFTEQTARHLRDELDPYVRKQSGDLPPAANIKIQHYFTDTKDWRKRLQTLCKQLLRAAGRNGRYYLAVK
jgi:hypothetical protein